MKIFQRQCPICSHPKGRILHHQEFAVSEDYPLPSSYDIVVCESCGFCFADTPVTQEGYDNYYANMSKYADSDTSTGAGLSPWDASRLEGMAEQVLEFANDRSERILDIGCANGGLILALRQRGFLSACGIDPSTSCVEQSVKLVPESARVGTLTTFPAEIGFFDGIILSHVMEHVCDLHSAMERLKGILKPGGWIYIEVPDASRYKDFLVAPFQDFNTEHLNHFSPRGLSNLFQMNKFNPVKIGTKTIFSAKDIPYPANYGFARMENFTPEFQKDAELANSLEGYVVASHALMSRIDTTIKKVINESPEIIVWGTGQLTMKLLSDTCLANAKVSAFVDGNPVNQGKLIREVRVIGGDDLSSSTIPILVSSLINAGAIIQTIRRLGLTNPVMTLLGEQQ